jgi:hypothetical protein
MVLHDVGRSAKNEFIAWQYQVIVLRRQRPVTFGFANRLFSVWLTACASMT